MSVPFFWVSSLKFLKTFAAVLLFTHFGEHNLKFQEKKKYEAYDYKLHAEPGIVPIIYR